MNWAEELIDSQKTWTSCNYSLHHYFLIQVSNKCISSLEVRILKSSWQTTIHNLSHFCFQEIWGSCWSKIGIKLRKIMDCLIIRSNNYRLSKLGQNTASKMNLLHVQYAFNTSKRAFSSPVATSTTPTASSLGFFLKTPAQCADSK